ncbi:MAG: dTMP kinase [Candidatus Eisenbacteria bacterium]|nr:dTMP kinase [Candidatus Eisenbacteria bacterium]
MSAWSGLFITFEGVEGSGKSTQADALARSLSEFGLEVVRSREPGGTPLGERIREILLDRSVSGMEPRAELMLFLASRAEHVERLVLPALRRGAVVISDRYADASVAYQGGGRELGTDLVERLNETATGGVQPDVTFLIDVTPEAGQRRKSRDPHAPDRIEEETLAFHERVRNAYLGLASREPSRFVIVNGERDRDEIADEILARTRDLMKTRRTGRGEGRT